MRLISQLFVAVLRWTIFLLSCCVPKDRRRVAVGAWMGRVYSDNPKYFFEYLACESDLDVRWIGTKAQRDQMAESVRAHFLPRESWRAIWFAMRAQWWVCCQGEIDISKWPLYGRVKCLNLWHGIPLKLMGELTPKAQARRAQKPTGRWMRLLNRILRPRVLEWTITSSPKMTQIMCGCFPGRFSPERVISCGSPRNDYIFNHRNDRELLGRLRGKYADLLGFSANQKIVIYVPTWRMNSTTAPFAFYGLDEVRGTAWRQMLLSHDAVLIEKHHFNTLKAYPVPEARGCALQITEKGQESVDIQELLLIADVLVSDYSSVYIDYALTGKSCVHFVYDYDQYVSQDSGLAYRMEEVAGGPLVKTESELLSSVDRLLLGEKLPMAEKFPELVAFENGTSCQMLTKFISNS